jgi:hypothetical protein
MDLWLQLTTEGKFDLIRKLGRVENREPGYGTIIVPSEGFSDRDETHNMVLDWLKAHNINILNVGLEKRCLELALNPVNSDFCQESD